MAGTTEENARLHLFTDEQPVVPVYAGLEPHEARQALKRKEEPSYQGTFTSARRYVLTTFANSESALMKRRVSRYMVSSDCPLCGGKHLRRESLSVTFAGFDITDISRLPLKLLAEKLRPYAAGTAADLEKIALQHPEKRLLRSALPKTYLRGSQSSSTLVWVT